MALAIDALDLRPARAADEPALARFAAALEDGHPARAAIQAWWRYAASHPSGLRAWVAAGEAEHELAAFVAVRGVRVRVDGHETVFGELCGAASHPAVRGVRGPRLIAALLSRHFDAYCAQERDLVTYGLAGDDDWRLLRHGLELEILRRQPALVLDVAGAADAPTDGARLVSAFDERALALYDRCSPAWRASAVRDASTLAWRFPAEGPYRRVVAGDEHGALAGLAVAAPNADRHLDVLDWLVPEDEPEAGELLHRALCALARSLGLARVRADLPPWSKDFARFQQRGFRVAPTRDFVLARSAHTKLDVWWLRDHWWLQPFDVARPRRASAALRPAPPAST